MGNRIRVALADTFAGWALRLEPARLVIVDKRETAPGSKVGKAALLLRHASIDA